MFATRTCKAVALATVFLATAAFAEAAAKQKVTALIIRATNSNNVIDKRLKPIADQLKKDLKYKGFQLIGTASGKVKIDEKWSTKLTDEYGLDVTPVDRKGDRVKLRVEYFKVKDDKRKSLLKATFTLEAGKYQLLGGGRLGRDAMVVAVTAE